MNTFDGFKLTGANSTRYILIRGNASGIVGAYRKAVGVKIRAKVKHVGKIELGLVPLFLLDGRLSPKILKKAVAKLGLVTYVAIYRPFDPEIKKQLRELHQKCRDGGYIKEDGSDAEWVDDTLLRYENGNDFTREHLKPIVSPHLDYEKAKIKYLSAIQVNPIDAVTGKKIVGDINDFLFEWAKSTFPLGIESVLEANVKQSAILKHKFFMDGMEALPAPKYIRQSGTQMTLLDFGKPCIQDTITELRRLILRKLNLSGAVRLFEIIEQCAEIGLYKGNVTLYVLGATLKSFNEDNTVFYDGVINWKYTEVLDTSTWFLQAYELQTKGRSRSIGDAALFFDNTGLKARLEDIFNMKPTHDKRVDTLGMATVMICSWIAENLRYPIAFFDDTLYKLLRDKCLYGEKLKYYDNYFTPDKCKWLKARISHSDTIARKKIKNIVGFDPDTTEHGMSNLPKGHYAPVLYSANDYIADMLNIVAGRVTA
jgi:hypothetical protein